MAGLFAIFAAIYFWFPKMFGRMMNERLGALHFWITLAGAYAIFMPMHLLGAAGHPRRYSELTGVQYVATTAPLQVFITVAAVVTVGGQSVFLLNLFWSMYKGPKAGANPWDCSTLEWRDAGFDDRTPAVQHGPYEYSVPGAEKDFVAQDAPGNRRN
jgi:cytochrome c oxidase subunit 1